MSPDGEHYVFSAGGEDVLISKKDYESLTEDVSYGNMTIDNKLILTKEHGAFSVRKRKSGSIILNTFTYMLKRDSPLKTGNTETFLKAVNANADKIIAGMRFLIEENIFLRSSDAYPELNTAFEELRLNKSHFRGRR